jgi:hypothetical protein
MKERRMNGRRMVAGGVVVAAVTVGAVAGALIGVPGLSGASSSPNVVTAASGTTTTTPGSVRHHRDFRGGMRADDGVFAAAAKALGLSTQDLMTKLSDGTTTIAEVAKAQNVDLSKVTDAMKAVADSRIDDIVNKPFPKRPDFGGTGMGGKGFGPGRMGGGMGFGFGDLRGSVDSLAKSLGISTQDLVKDLAGGQSIADIAKAHNVDVNTIINSLVTDATNKINDAVKAGHLKQDTATKIEANLKDMITKAVNGDFKFGFGAFGGGKGGHAVFPGFGGPGGPGGYPGGPMGASGASGSTTTPPTAG